MTSIAPYILNIKGIDKAFNIYNKSLINEIRSFNVDYNILNITLKLDNVLSDIENFIESVIFFYEINKDSMEGEYTRRVIMDYIVSYCIYTTILYRLNYIRIYEQHKDNSVKEGLCEDLDTEVIAMFDVYNNNLIDELSNFHTGKNKIADEDVIFELVNDFQHQFISELFTDNIFLHIDDVLKNSKFDLSNIFQTLTLSTIPIKKTDSIIFNLVLMIKK